MHAGHAVSTFLVAIQAVVVSAEGGVLVCAVGAVLQSVTQARVPDAHVGVVGARCPEVAAPVSGDSAQEQDSDCNG